ncbi:DUF4199 domain-containing protein [Myroides indicus]|uniref:Uncharacterized protein DUF4199 n=1 Tax=Myroides indicus TaxID=1323422 RepID=A0A4R7F5Q0_9FLAO|nr:DUF4199 domain-containing protein [Myroides indicus]TDS59597.1 uncharacterized protein DUF4199 [Myroides indicus]
MKNPIHKVGIIFGIILAAYYILFNVISFFTSRNLFTDKFAGFANMGVIIVIGLLTIILAKKKAGGFLTFREAFTPYLIMVVIGVSTNAITYYLLFNFVDPSAKEEINKTLYEMLVQTLNNSGLPEADIQDQLNKASKLDQFQFKSQLFSWAGSILRNSILGLFLAAIFKNKSEFSPLKQEESNDIKVTE